MTHPFALFPAILQKISDRDSARVKELPSMEELNRKDVPYDGFLNKIGGAITGQRVDITAGRVSMPFAVDLCVDHIIAAFNNQMASCA